MVVLDSDNALPASRPILDAREAAALLRVSTKTLLRLARAGQIPGLKVGREWRFSAEALTALVGTARAS